MATLKNPVIFETFEENPRDASVFNTADADEGKLATCEDAVAVILAHDISATPLQVAFEDPAEKPVVCGEDGKTPRPLQEYEGRPAVAYAVEAALGAGVSEVVLVAPEDEAVRAQVVAAAEAALAAARGTGGAPSPAEIAGAKGEAGGCGPDATGGRRTAGAAGARMTAVPYDSAAAEAARVASRSFELYSVPEYLLEIARDAVAATPGAKHALLLSCDQVRITPTHLRALRSCLDAHPEVQVVTSWITWLRRTPFLLTGAFLEDLAARSERARALPYPLRPVEHVEMRDVVFGEEKIAANATVPPAVAEFFDGLRMTAPQAVRLARNLRKADPAERDAKLATLSASDRELLSIAEETLSDLGARVAGEGADLGREVAWASAWGARNKLDFPLLNDRKRRDSFAYLDSAATAQRAGTALEAQREFDAQANANVYRGGYDLSMQATFALNDARAAVEGFIGAKRREVVYTANTTDGANLVARCWGNANVGPGDLVVTTIAEHHSNLLPWLLLARRRGARLAYVPLDARGFYDLDSYRGLLAQGPKLVALAQVGNVLGLENPLGDMVAEAKAAGARVFVDAAQGMPHVKTDVYALGCDFYAFSGHKLYGPMGIGGVWVHPEALAEMEPDELGGGAVSHVAYNSFYLRLGAIGFENGTPPVSQAMGLAAAVEYLGALGMDNVARHSRALTRYLMAGLRDVDGVTVWGDHSCEAGGSGLVSASVAGTATGEVGATMGKVGVAVRSGGHCAMPLAASLGVIGTTRVSIGVYNTAEDIEAALVGLRLCRKLRP